jgi:hypothetical protein
MISNHTRGKGYWKFNNSLLNDIDLVKMVKETINETKIQYAAAPYNEDNVTNCPNSAL